MSFTEDINTDVEEILHTKTVSRARTLMESRSGLWVVALSSFVESATPLPILTDPFMIAAIVLNRARMPLIVLVTTLSSVAGGVAAYLTATFALDLILTWMTPEMNLAFQNLIARYSDGTVLFTIVGAITPIPYTTTAYAVAALKGNLAIFIAASLFGRGMRFSIVGTLAYYFGPAAVTYARRWIGIISIGLLIALGVYIGLHIHM
jgi:membrane protein YqaA with SNARE-associated domain